ncbi:hypothetical protein [Algoriphagus namhaensis]
MRISISKATNSSEGATLFITPYEVRGRSTHPESRALKGRNYLSCLTPSGLV